MSILSTLNKLTGKHDKSVLAALNSLTGKTADDIEEAMGNLSTGSGSAPMTKIVLLKGPYDEDVSPLFPSTPSVGLVEYVYGDEENRGSAEFTPTDEFSDIYGGTVLVGEIPAGAYIPQRLGSPSVYIDLKGYKLSIGQMCPCVTQIGAIIMASEPDSHIPLFVEKSAESV